MKAYERLMRYAQYATASDENSDNCPSTPAQLDFAAALVDELKALGLTDAAVDKNGYVFATIPASEGCESAPVIGFIAHMDVSPEVEDKNVQPRALVYGGGARAWGAFLARGGIRRSARGRFRAAAPCRPCRAPGCRGAKAREISLKK